MSLCICDNCFKPFKTTQHLNQHKNRKNKCKTYIKNNENFLSPLTLTPCDSSINSLDNSIHSKTDETTNTDNSNQYDSIVSALSYPLTNDSNSFESSNYPNLSVTNLLDFIKTHKKVVEDKMKLESTVIVLSNKINKLNKENYNLKRKLMYVNNFISDYKKQEKEVMSDDLSYNT
jgi:hypothetical protein